MSSIKFGKFFAIISSNIFFHTDPFPFSPGTLAMWRTDLLSHRYLKLYSFSFLSLIFFRLQISIDLTLDLLTFSSSSPLYYWAHLVNFLILDFILCSKFPLFLFAPNLILSYPCTFTSWNIIEIAALKSLMIPKAWVILGLTLFFAWRTGYIFLGLSGWEEYQVMWDVSWTFCVRFVSCCIILFQTGTPPG